ncbi:MAG: DNA replication/repair protein RecF [Deltaproteobacteria bacterium]|nr:DNA replication/repair protein RecF [Deltaproteobacteria bacterium]
MRLLHAELTDFRNIACASLDPSPRFTALVGNNGQGKTNALEALYLVAALRPLRSVSRRALLRTGTELAKIELKVERRSTGLVHDLGVELTPTRRTLFKDGKKVDAGTFIGCAVAVSFTPDDLQLAKGSPDLRRKFLDRALLNVRPSYLTRALRYTKALKDRNRVLGEPNSDPVLDAYDEIIAHEGAAIMAARVRYVSELLPRVRDYFERIATPAPRLDLAYGARLRDMAGAEEPDLEAAFLAKLRARRPVDRARRTTSVGPHLDDLELALDGLPVKERASQGQHRALVLALKLAEITHLAAALGEAPLLLLDDMSSELDAHRSAQLFEAVGALDGQVILTSTEVPTALAAADLALYRVKAGNLERGPAAPAPV